MIVIYRTIITHDGTGELPVLSSVGSPDADSRCVERKIKYYALESTDVLAKLAGTEAAWYRPLLSYSCFPAHACV